MWIQLPGKQTKYSNLTLGIESHIFGVLIPDMQLENRKLQVRPLLDLPEKHTGTSREMAFMLLQDKEYLVGTFDLQRESENVC